ncbi:hypothetical protein ABC628_10875 [Lentilactobacillus otakiensis]|uniref:Uncharacterized protein n=1 Tax=Lentilactobacillus otakiensis DSM 19908 = JCM 15040 TaxID=1423780 RepID=S4PQH0_9LACO|nr:hypothetical protein [Lentilactobacillus otakiensis]KRL10894.1 hypothetical protein FD05_GL000043 [Lentilactobacillus otakiensis DSM 19908 = JCM 15040]MBZ3777414.1 hypothetical protein [Lentilactobacillus otakiensis]MDV3517722.1 hypothetical protein [Lentilactobacillus otakiensis]GAD17230.1 hypothetical protein LOT_1768 [Lentilactobacillus otakiensis DSM 19908 = JCM 15040]
MINRACTIQNAKAYLNEYKDWKIKAISNSSDRAQHECQIRIEALDKMSQVDESTALLADLLRDRYINRWTSIKTFTDLADKYHMGFISERTGYRYQNMALLIFAHISSEQLLCFQ